MNLKMIDNDLREELISQEEMIGIFVLDGSFYWVIDWEFHFNLDESKNIDAMCYSNDPDDQRMKPDGLTVEEWRQSLMTSFRSGIPTLIRELLPQYLESASAKQVSTDQLRNLFWSFEADKYSILVSESEKYRAGGYDQPLEVEVFAADLFSFLPKFYIDFDRNIFRHIVAGRMYDAVALDGWDSDEGDFDHFIPHSHRYWVSEDGVDMWDSVNYSV